MLHIYTYIHFLYTYLYEYTYKYIYINIYIYIPLNVFAVCNTPGEQINDWTQELNNTCLRKYG